MRAVLANNTNALAAFIEEHSRDGEPIQDGGWYLFPDSAMAQGGAFGNCLPPPDDPEEVARLRLRYAELRFQIAKQALAELSTDLLQNPPPRHMQDEVLARLRQAKKEQTRAWRAYERALAEYEELDGPRARAEKRNRRAAGAHSLERERWKDSVLEIIKPDQERN